MVANEVRAEGDVKIRTRHARGRSTWLSNCFILIGTRKQAAKLT